jgi:hypothetical protein
MEFTRTGDAHDLHDRNAAATRGSTATPMKRRDVTPCPTRWKQAVWALAVLDWRRCANPTDEQSRKKAREFGARELLSPLTMSTRPQDEPHGSDDFSLQAYRWLSWPSPNRGPRTVQVWTCVALARERPCLRSLESSRLQRVATLTLATVNGSSLTVVDDHAKRE